jgi:eukaryotic-like serine/threonine-protein kinase
MPRLRAMELSAGTIIAQRYELEKPLGEGGMGAVWSARHLFTEKSVALKFLKGPADLDLVKRFVREARAASAVRHPNVIGIHDILLLDDGLPAMVMDLLHGESLADRLERTGPIPVHELASIMVPVLSAVGAAHAAGIVHRDLKPDNIFLADRGDGSVQAMVLDFGICKLNSPEGLVRDASTLTVSGSMLGTPCYMSPEQIFGERDVDARADVWALGVILYECVAGKRPFEGENIGQIIKQISSVEATPLQDLVPDLLPEFADLVRRMLAKERSERPADLREPFFTLSELTAVQAQSFGGAAQPLVLASIPPLAATADTVLAAETGGSIDPLHVSTRILRVAKRPLAAVLIGSVSTVALLWFLGARLSSDKSSESPEIAVSSAPAAATVAVVAAATGATTVAAPPIFSAAAASASSSPPPPLASSAGRGKLPKHKTTLAGGVHGDVPF